MTAPDNGEDRSEPIILYRARQLFQALRARLEDPELEVLDRELDSNQRELFFQMPRQDQRHSLDVFHTLKEAGYDDASLLRAALLHDVGKIGGRRRIKLVHRALVVLLEAFCPWLLLRLSSSSPGDWREPFYLHVNHPRLGAEMAEEAGCSAEVVEYIRTHHQAEGNGPGQALQRADSAN